MNKKIENTSIIIVSYNSSKKIVKLVKKIPYQTPILIIDNSNDQKLKKIFKKKNISIYFKKNQGYGSSINYAVKKIKTEYFLVIQPDVIGINKNSLITFFDYAKKLKNKFTHKNKFVFICIKCFHLFLCAHPLLIDVHLFQ